MPILFFGFWLAIVWHQSHFLSELAAAMRGDEEWQS